MIRKIRYVEAQEGTTYRKCEEKDAVEEQDNDDGDDDER